ncbi:hypothetical protein FQN54_009234 [Arachnomyces sp. PD_36]|nr:hypothetical protein FQN54_009234 [Arachnomyces sp. PD_36]
MDTPNQDNNRGDGPPGTPPQPPYSPVTPILSTSALIPPPDSVVPLPTASTSMFDTSTNNGGGGGDRAGDMGPPVFMQEPAPVPISESENPDAIALRSAISILQIQKQQSLRDIRTLDQMKKTAAAHPEEFVKQLTAGKLSSPDSGELLSFTPESTAQNAESEDAMETDDDKAETGGPQQPASEAQVDFGKIPKPQNVVRMPPINWAKYHIVGEPLDKLAEEQRRRPSPGEPRRDLPGESQRAPEHFIAAPYRPFVDKIEPPMRTRSSNKGKNS